MSTLTTDNRVWDHYYLEEADAAFLYRALAVAETDPKRKDLFAILTEAKDPETGLGFNQEEIISESTTLVVAGLSPLLCI